MNRRAVLAMLGLIMLAALALAYAVGVAHGFTIGADGDELGADDPDLTAE